MQRPVRPHRSRRVLATTLVVAVSVVALTLSAAVAGAKPGRPKPSSTTWSQTRWVAPGDDRAVTVQVDPLPDDASQATFRVVVQRASDPTRVAVCGGSTATSTCKDAAPTPARYDAFTTTVDLVGADRQITLHSTASAARVTVSLVGHTTSPRTSASTGSPSERSAPTEPAVTGSETPSVSETSVTAAPSETAGPTIPPPIPTKGWPGASNTGVPAGTSLRVVDGPASTPPGTTWSGNLMTVVGDGTVLDGLEIRGLVRVEAKNVVIKNSKITGRRISSANSLLYVAASGSVTVTDCEIYAAEPSVYVDGVIGQNFTLERVDIHDVVDNVKIIGDNVTVRDSWLHRNLHYANDPAQGGKPTHDDNVQVQKGSNITLSHNTMESSHNAALQVTQDMGTVSKVTVDRNLVSGGSCSFNLADKGKGALRDVSLRNNRFTRTSTYNCAITVSSASHSTLSLSDNRWATWSGSAWVDGEVVVAARS
ncbi:MAG: right-handed parallel beta-helix repeat-containing protein [Micrococcales bacterium]|nr:right-handed parallel beta-helix repeat-containing protein [Micrococcales bacterium]